MKNALGHMPNERSHALYGWPVRVVDLRTTTQTICSPSIGHGSDSHGSVPMVSRHHHSRSISHDAIRISTEVLKLGGRLGYIRLIT